MTFKAIPLHYGGSLKVPKINTLTPKPITKQQFRKQRQNFCMYIKTQHQSVLLNGRRVQDQIYLRVYEERILKTHYGVINSSYLRLLILSLPRVS